VRTGFRSGDERVRKKGLANEHVTERCQRIMSDAEWGRERRERERCVEAARGVGGDSAGGGRGDGGESGGLQISRLQQQVIEIYDSD